MKKTKRGQWEGGKGSARRNSNEKAYADNWDKIFGKKAKLEPSIDDMLSDYLDGLLILSPDCPVTNIEAYETGKFLKSSSNCGIKCYRLAAAIRNIRKQK